MPIDPLQLTSEIKSSYIRYLTSSFRIKNQTLRNIFFSEADNYWFFNGPILESTPPFQTGRFLKDLVNDRTLDPKIEAFIYEALPYLKNNPLRLHQEIAINKIIAALSQTEWVRYTVEPRTVSPLET